ncbi:hypothetical protein [Methylobacterium sp. 13MFTsu3.1M2]|uniref:hypothetical protein n=1 Tax=Methylobacterium sp. 13MFTsu3.1M2 TaxID=1502776 RepID=UPI0008E116B0|nr:hypothetical protein [Methylobacterium sp. 13MFTsu3.1M2]SFE95057.1 NADP-dependent aldehyde dehydrogenase [Methylobacterium sp. 13MFTsu3.1M2]
MSNESTGSVTVRGSVRVGAGVAPAMVQGGPFPATSGGRDGAVGPLATERMPRPVLHRDLARRIDGARAPQPGH